MPSAAPMTPHSPTARAAGAALVLAALAWITIAMAFFPRWTVDDAFITFRYAENLARHGALTWNVGADPVEGYTGIALPLLLAAGLVLGIDPVLASHALGLIALGVTAFALERLARSLGAGPVARGAALLALLAHPSLPAHVSSGLETMLFAAALLVSQAALLAALTAPSAPDARRESCLLLALTATALVRPEGFLLAAIFVLGMSYERARRGRAALRGWIGRTAGLLALPLGVYVAWRYGYYGRLLPNTYYAKQAASFPHPPSLADLALFARRYLALPAVAGILFAGLGALRRQGASRPGPSARRAGSIPLFTALVLAFAGLTTLKYVGSSLAMNYSHRFWMPLYVSLLPLAALALERGLGALAAVRAERGAAGAVAAILVAGLGLAQLAIMAGGLPHEVRTAASYEQLLDESHLRIGRLLAAVSPALGPDPPRLVTVRDAGAIPYLSRLPTVDFGLLNDEYLGQAPRSEREMADYFFAARPAIVTMTGFHGRGPIARYLTDDPRFAEFLPWLRYANRSPLYRTQYQEIYVRRDLLPALEGRRRTLEAGGALPGLDPIPAGTAIKTPNDAPAGP